MKTPVISFTTILFLFIAQLATAQFDPSKLTNYKFKYGDRLARIQADTVMSVPVDTSYSKVGIARIDSVLWVGNGTKWTATSTSAVGTETIDLLSLKRNGKLLAKGPVAKRLSELRAVATADLDTGFIYSTTLAGNTRKYRYDPDDVSSADDSAAVIVTGSGKRFKQIFDGVYTPEKFGAVGDGVTDDWWAFQKALNYLFSTGGTLQLNGKGNYYIDTTKFIDLRNAEQGKIIVIQGNGARMSGKNIFARIPIDQDEFSTRGSGTIKIYDITFTATHAGSGTAINLGMVMYSGAVGCTFVEFDEGFVTKFGLWSSTSGNTAIRTKYGFTYTFGDWPGADAINSQSNVSISLLDSYNAGTGGIGFRFIGSGECRLDHATVQGNSVRWGVYFDSYLSTVVKNFEVRTLHYEMNGATDSGIIFIRPPSTGTVVIEDLYQQGTVPVTVFVNNEANTNPLIQISRIPYLSGVKFASNSNQTNWEFDGMAPGFNYESHFDVTGSNVLPLYAINRSGEGVIEAAEFHLKSKGQLFLYSPNAIRSEATHVFSSYAAPLNQDVQILGVSALSNRWASSYIKNGYFQNVYADTTGGFSFGDDTYNYDLHLKRESNGLLSIVDYLGSYKNIKAAQGTFTAPTGYTSDISFADLPDTAFITKDHAQDLFDAAGTTLQFDALFINDGSTSSPKSLDTIQSIATKPDIDTLRIANSITNSRIDSLLNDFPAGSSGGLGQGRTTIGYSSNIGDSLYFKVNDSTYIGKKLVSGINTTWGFTDSTAWVNSTPGSAEVNTIDTTLIAGGAVPVPGDCIIEYIIAESVSDLLALKAGRTLGSDNIIYTDAINGGDETIYDVSTHIKTAQNIYFSGITSSTHLQIVYKKMNR